MARKPQFRTVYHLMDEAGVFELNPANADARDINGNVIYTGPVAFPKMFYHPTGARRIIQPGEYISTPFGPKLVNELSELIWEIAATPEDEKRLRLKGWWDHPAKAVEAGGGPKAPERPEDTIAALQRQIAELQVQQAGVQAEMLAETRSSGARVGKSGPTVGV